MLKGLFGGWKEHVPQGVSWGTIIGAYIGLTYLLATNVGTTLALLVGVLPLFILILAPALWRSLTRQSPVSAAIWLITIFTVPPIVLIAIISGGGGAATNTAIRTPSLPATIPSATAVISGRSPPPTAAVEEPINSERAEQPEPPPAACLVDICTTMDQFPCARVMEGGVLTAIVQVHLEELSTARTDECLTQAYWPFVQETARWNGMPSTEAVLHVGDILVFPPVPCDPNGFPLASGGGEGHTQIEDWSLGLRLAILKLVEDLDRDAAVAQTEAIAASDSVSDVLIALLNDLHSTGLGGQTEREVTVQVRTDGDDFLASVALHDMSETTGRCKTTTAVLLFRLAHDGQASFVDFQVNEPWDDSVTCRVG